MEYYIKTDRLIAHRPVRVFAEDSTGKPCGEYDGYWKPEQCIVILYPAKGSWIYGALKKHTVSERQIRIRRYA